MNSYYQLTDVSSSPTDFLAKVAEIQDLLDKKKAQSAILMETTSKARQRKNELEQKLSKATKEKLELEQEYYRRSNNIGKMVKRIKLLEQQINDVNEQQIKDTQVLLLSNLPVCLLSVRI
ncbi:hypothetical protein HanOQP8_Chr01g0034701 [Helianthus annuus]|nr:hypothetical protein HanOQP8_Chr01g0034701 [Helianthus annuus]